MSETTRILHPTVARQIISDLVSEHALEKITEHLSEYCHDALADEDIDMLGPAAWDQALGEIREEIATMGLDCTWGDQSTRVDPTIVAVRKSLIDESYALFDRRKAFYKTIETPAVGTTEFDTYEAMATAGAYAYLLAAILRVASSQMGEGAARDLATLVDAVMEDGTEAIQDANDDLDERAHATAVDQ